MPHSKSSCQKTTYRRYRKGAFFFLFPLIRIYDPLFEALEDKGLVEAIANGNFARIMPSRGITLERDFMYPEARYTDRLAPRPQP